MGLYEELITIKNSDMRAALCTVVRVSGSTPRKAGAKMIVIKNSRPAGKIIGSIGGGAIEHHLRNKALEIIDSGSAELLTISLRNELAMCCGGEMSVFVEPIESVPKLIIFGAGHISQALFPMAVSLGFNVTVADEREELLNHEVFQAAIVKSYDLSLFSINNLPFCSNTYIIVATHDHALDQRVCEAVLDKKFKFLGLVGSLRKKIMTGKRFEAKGFHEKSIEKINCPVGIDIFAATPAEIAISICAQLVKVKNEPLKNRQLDNSGRAKLSHGQG